ncbi:MAG TPA: 4Fe-4S double cluster binding domain-containing protein [Anaerolineae bacterium]|nr:4Fe-4S double cluster binding domain-containing protein [Anaerolineae bacterium]
MPGQLLQRLQGRGHRSGVLSAQRLVDLQQDIEARHRDGLFDAEFYEERLTSFEFQPPDSLPGATSILVVAVPDPAARITFTRHGEQFPFVVPPTYLHWREVDKRVEDAAAEILAPGGHRVALANLPKKLTAVRSGLAAYGKNNVTYVPGMGSFHRLVVLWSDLPSKEDNWHDLRMMDACQKCMACQRACPTEAIDPDRFLLRAERCLTFLNEKPPDVPFPAWVDPSWHNCLVGCLRCQRVCPENKAVRDWVVGDEVLSEEETALVLEGTAPEHLPPKAKEKLERLDLIDLLDVLPRNLSALLGD